MKKLILTILILFFAVNLYAYEVLPGSDYETESVILNEELRSASSDIDTINDTIVNVKYKYVYFLLPDDTLTTGTDKLGRIYIDFDGTISQVDASVKTAPTSASIICDLNKNGTTIWSTQANRITIAATENTGTQSTFNVATFSSGDYFTIDIDQVGSGTAGAKLVIRMKILED